MDKVYMINVSETDYKLYRGPIDEGKVVGRGIIDYR